MIGSDNDGIIKVLKTTNARIMLGDKWLVWYFDEWLVQQRQPYQKRNRCLYSGESLAEALQTLAIGGE